MNFSLLAQLDRASDYGSEGYGFESLVDYCVSSSIGRAPVCGAGGNGVVAHLTPFLNF